MRADSAPTLVETQDATASASQFAEDVAFYLTQTPRQLPSRYLYDALGSTLFDAICRLPWYRVTRAEMGLLTRHGTEILGALDPLARIVELGAGSGEKLAVLLSARRADAAALSVHLVDVSRAALDTAALAIGPFANVTVVAYEARYHAWLEAAKLRADSAASPHGRTLTVFLGSNIGNFDPPAADSLLHAIRATLRPGDAFLLGADLIKPERELLLAYDDPLGVTAAFNRNLIVRINRELGATLTIDSFRHHVVWNREASRIEMHLVSTRSQQIRIPAAGLDIRLQEGEAIWTESSYKYRAEDVERTLERCGFRPRAQWLDRDAGFALILADVPG